MAWASATTAGTPAATCLPACKLLLPSSPRRLLSPACPPSAALPRAVQFLACKQVADRYRVEIRCGGMNSGDWPALRAAAHVLCMTPQTLLNMVSQGVAKFDQIDALVSTLAVQGCAFAAALRCGEGAVTAGRSALPQLAACALAWGLQLLPSSPLTHLGPC